MDQDDHILAYIQGKLSSAEMATFEQLMSQDPNLAVEVQALQAARAEFAAEDQSLDTAQGWARLETAIVGGEMVAANSNRPLRFSFLQTGGLIAASLALWQIAVVPLMQTGQDQGYQTVSEIAQGPVLDVMFVNSANLSAITALMLEVDGTIIEGPSAIGLYNIEFPDIATRDAALATMLDRVDLIDMVSGK